MELLLVLGLGALVAAVLWRRRNARPATQPPPEGAPLPLTRRLQRLWWPPADEPVPRARWSSLPPR